MELGKRELMDDQTAIALLAEMRQIHRLLRELPSAFAVALAARERGSITASDRAVLDVLLDPLTEAMGQAKFPLADLDRQAELYPALHDALSQLRADGMTTKRLGKMFSRIEGVDLGGAVIWQRGKGREGQWWQIVRV